GDDARPPPAVAVAHRGPAAIGDDDIERTLSGEEQCEPQLIWQLANGPPQVELERERSELVGDELIAGPEGGGEPLRERLHVVRAGVAGREGLGVARGP